MAKEQTEQAKNKVATASKQPEYNMVDISCACGAKYKIGTTEKGPIRVSLCSNCHPFYTGEQKIVDTENLVSKFEEKAKLAQTDVKSRKEKRQDKRASRSKVPVSSKSPQKELTLKDIMAALQKGK
jgi:large subunit ribosomal protein L31